MRVFYAVLVLAALTAVFWVAAVPSTPELDERRAAVPAVPEGAEVVMLGSGCFWKGGAIYPQIPGVLFVTAGYSGGKTENPTYQDVCGGMTGHSEVSRVVYDPKQTSLEKILKVFFASHQPTEKDGVQSKSVIFYSNEGQRKVAEAAKLEAAKYFKEPVVTEILPVGPFYAAEEYHQDYYRKAGGGSCGAMLTPRLKELGIK